MEPDDSAVVSHLQSMSAALRAQLPALREAVTGRILDDIEPLGTDQDMIDLLRVSVEGNLTSIVHAIGYQLPPSEFEAPAGAVEYARRLAQRGVPVSDLVRAYRVGQASFLQWCYGELAGQELDAETAIEVGTRMTDISFAYIDTVSEQVIVAYTRERDRWVRNAAAVRAAQVRALLEGGPVDVEHVEATLGYRLGQHHVGLLAWTTQAAPSATLVTLERLAGKLADRVSGSRALFVPRDESSAYLWLPLGTRPAAWTAAVADLPALLDDGPLRLAAGEPAHGVEGFRVTMREALRAHAVALVAGPARPPLTRFSVVAPAALLTADLDAARDWVLRVLGPLAADDDATARLRETLHVFLGTGGSYQETAERLVLHKNTVHYRVRKAEEIRGHPVGPDRLDVELALLVMHWLKPAILNHRPEP